MVNRKLTKKERVGIFMKKHTKGILLIMALIISFTLAACGNQTTEEAANEMQYMTVEETKDAIESGSDEYVFLDVRTDENYEKGHVDGFISADMDAANKEGDMADGVEEMTDALGTDQPSNDKTYVLMCNSGKSYAQAGTDVLIDEMGVDPAKIYTIEGGMEAWNNAGDEYQEMVK